jgi:hypothetical protein
MNASPGPTIIVEEFKRQDGFAGDSYKGLPVLALPGLHEFIARRATENFAPGCNLLDIAAGSGAMSQRMVDEGFRAGRFCFRAVLKRGQDQSG